MSAPGNLRRIEGSARDNWGTPEKLWKPLMQRFDFNLDVCADENNHKTRDYLSGPCIQPNALCQCGLCAIWGLHGSRAFMNPPFSATETWVKKAAHEASREYPVVPQFVVGLFSNATETTWFTRLVVPTAAEVIFLEGRIQFDEPPEVRDARVAAGEKKNGNTGGNILAVWRPDNQGVGYPRFSVWDWDA